MAYKKINGDKEEIERNKKYISDLLSKVRGDLKRSRFELGWIQNANAKLCEKGCADLIDPANLARADKLFEELISLF